MTTLCDDRRALIRALLTVALLLLVSPNDGSAQTWQIDYDASLGALPAAPDFVHAVSDPPPNDALGEGNYLVALGALTQGDTGGPNTDPGNTQWYEVTPPLFDFEADLVVVDLRLKILSSTMVAPPLPTPRAGFGVVVRDESGEFVILYIGSSGLFLWGSDSAAGVSLFAPFDTTLDFADYQLRVGADGASILVDGTLLATLERAEFGEVIDVSRTVYFGDVSGSELSSSQLETFSVSRFVPPAAQVHNYETVTEYVPSEFTSDSTSIKSRTVSCPAGKNALGGGVETIGADGNAGLLDSRPSGGPPATSWHGSARELVETSDDWRIRVDVICGEVSGYENLSFAEPHSTNVVQGSVLDCASKGKVVIGGGAGVSGANLRQTLLANRPLTNPSEWSAIAEDYGVATSSSAWGVEIDAICSDALNLEPDGVDVLDMVSPKQSIFNCPSGKVPISGGAGIAEGGTATEERTLRISRPKDGSPGEPPVGWLAAAHVNAAANPWQLTAEAYCAPIADPTVSKTGLMSRWKGDDGGLDSWFIGHGTLENGVGLVPGILGQGQSFSFDGVSDQWVKIPSELSGVPGAATSYDLYPEASFTVDAWFRTSAPAVGTMLIVNLHDGGGLNPGGSNDSAWSLRLIPGGFPLGAFRDTLGLSSTLAGPGPTDLADGELHHLAMVRDMDASLIHLYVDGVLEETEGITPTLNDGPLEPGDVLNADPVAIGIWRDGGATTLSSPFEGEIDDVKYWDRAVSEEEIQNVAGCSFDLTPRVLNLDASLFGSPVGDDHKLCVFLEAGEYDATLVDPGLHADARFTAWSPQPGWPWGTAYSVEPEVDPGFTTGLPVSASSAQEAFDDTVDKTAGFILSVDQRVYFSVIDAGVLDNRGGVSVLVEPVPEPSSVLMLTSGIGLLAILARRRERRARRSR